MLTLLLATACAPDADTLAVRWRSTHGDLTEAQAEAGFDWALALLGAIPPADAGHREVIATHTDGVTWAFDPSAAGLSSDALPAFEAATAPLQGSAELRREGAVDVGRLLMRTLYEPSAYYDITGALPTYAEWDGPRLVPEPLEYAVRDSWLIPGTPRTLRYNGAPTAIEDMAFIALTEGSEDIDVIDLMPNGMQRFATYDGEGVLQSHGDAEVGAGAPGKCAWCHEDHLMKGNPTNPGYDDFAAELDAMALVIRDLQQSLDTSIDFDTHEVHTWGELVVVEFLRPTPARVAAEWGVTEGEVDALVAEHGLSQGDDPEYPHRGAILQRTELDAVAREVIGYEPVAVRANERDP